MNDEEIGVDVELDEEEVAIDAQSDVLKGDKGEKGDPGIQGEPGEQGEPGYTPVKGVDYFTNEDIGEIEEDVEAGVITAITPTLNAKANADDVYTKSEVDTAMETKQNVISSSNKITSDLVDDTNQTNKFVTDSDKTTWGAKYDKPSGGIPKTDLDSSVQTSLGKADTALQSGDIENYVQNTDYATASKGGVVKVNDVRATEVSTFGTLQAQTKSYATYNSSEDVMFIGKGTLENVITGKQLVNETQLDTKADKSSLVTGEGTEVTLQNTAELEFIHSPLPRGNSGQVQYSGKNLYSSENISSLIAGVQYTSQEDGTILANGTKSGGSYANFSNNTVQLETGTYSATSFLLSGTINKSISVYLINATNSTSIYISELGRSGKSFTIEETGTYYLRLAIWDDGAVFTNAKIGFMLVSGSEIPTTFERYTYGQAPNPNFEVPISNVTGDVEVLVQNKNKLDYDFISDYNNVTSSTLKFVEIKGLKPNTTYFISNYDTSKANQVSIYAMGYEPNASHGQTITLKNNSWYYPNGKSFTTTETGKWYIGLYNPTTQEAFEEAIKVFETAQIEEGTTASTYTQHQEQTFTFPLGTQRMYAGDYLADDGIHHVKGQMTFDGTENWADYSTQYEGYYTGFTGKHFGRTGGFEQDILCNYFKNLGLGSPNPTLQGTMYATYMKVPNSIATNMTELKTWLGTHNVEVQYTLATETVEPYTTEQQAVYDEIKQAISYDEQTNISGTSDEANPIFEVQAVQYKEPDYWTIAYVNGQIGNAIGGAY